MVGDEDTCFHEISQVSVAHNLRHAISFFYNSPLSLSLPFFFLSSLCCGAIDTLRVHHLGRMKMELSYHEGDQLPQPLLEVIEQPYDEYREACKYLWQSEGQGLQSNIRPVTTAMVSYQPLPQISSEYSEFQNCQPLVPESALSLPQIALVPYPDSN